MRVLLVSDGLWSDVGGGQSLYRDWIREHRDTEFVALVPEAHYSSAAAHGPENLTWLPLNRFFRDRFVPGMFSDLGDSPLGSLVGAEEVIAWQMDVAGAVSGQAFDVIDVPDYVPFGALLPFIIRAHGGTLVRHVLSMHGSLADALEEGWDQGVTANAIRTLETWHYLVADQCYGISDRYLASWESITGRRGEVVRLPATRLKVHRPIIQELEAPALPDLCFVGRQEKCKGPDLFVEFCSRLPEGLFESFVIVGPAVNSRGVDSRTVLTQMAEARRLPMRFELVAPEDMGGWIQSGRKVVMLPSRRDTFNLVALEALLAGTPVVLSRDAGAFSYLREHMPSLPFVDFDPDDLMSAYSDVVRLASSYPEARSQLIDALAQLSYFQPPGVSLVDAFMSGTSVEPELRNVLDEFAHLLVRRFGEVSRVDASECAAMAEEMAVDSLGADDFGPLSPTYVRSQVEMTLAIAGRLRDVTPDEVVQTLLPALANGLNRAALYRWLAREQIALGSEELYATYMCRAMRLSGRYPPEDVGQVQGCLNSLGLREEAVVLDILSNGSDEDMYQYLWSRRKLFRDFPHGDARVIHEQRRINEPRTSVVVSLYNAAEHLPVFLDNISRLSSHSRQTVELILVDSGSSDDTAALAIRLLRAHLADFSAMVVSTSKRETIQKAWNRGIYHSRGRYLAFLGTDESVRPDTFDLLGDYLDSHSEIDWVQGDAVVTNVNQAGSYLGDVCRFHRGLVHPFAFLLDTVLVGHVGALYRRSVHERFGLYDETFRGAGDTEFKNRVLPHLKVETLPTLLGTYLNYTGDRVTSSSFVELEDLRAWYAFRTPGGIQYVMGDHNPSILIGLFEVAHDYLRSYSAIPNTDLELGVAVSELSESLATEKDLQLHERGTAMRVLLDSARAIDDFASISALRFGLSTKEILPHLAFGLRQVKLARGIVPSSRTFHLLNDNRYMQHNWIWPGTRLVPQVETLSATSDLGWWAARIPGQKAPSRFRDVPLALAIPRQPATGPDRASAERVAAPSSVRPRADVEDFDEVAYLQLYTDVASALANGMFSSGWDHYEAFGRSEGRWAPSRDEKTREATPSVIEADQTDLGSHNFDDTLYLDLYPDVRLAVARGLFKSAWEHYEEYGREEGRVAQQGSRKIPMMPRSIRKVTRWLTARGPE